MSGSQDLVGAALLGLVVADVMTAEHRPALAAMVTGNGPDANTHAAVVQVGLQVLGAGVLTLVAGTSPKAGTACLTVVAALWVLWFVAGGPNRPGSYSSSFDPFRVKGQLRPPVPVGPPVGTGPAKPTKTFPGFPEIPGMPYPTMPDPNKH